MKCTTNLLLGAALLGSCALPQAALADSVTFTLSDADQTTPAGTDATLVFSGSLTAPLSNTGDEYVNGDAFSVTSNGQNPTLDDSALILSTPIILVPGGSFTGDLFSLLLDSSLASGTYAGTLTLLGGASQQAYDPLATTTFSATLTPAAVAETPEPSSLILLATGLLGACGTLRRRFSR